MKIAFFGTPRFAQIVLEKLIDSPFKPSIIVTAPDAKSGRGQKLIPTPVKQTALGNSIEILQPENLNDSRFKIDDLRFDMAILTAYGKIIPKEILNIPKFGFINVHPSLLPKYRGPSPIQSALLNGETKTGVSIILLDEQIDHGLIFSRQEIKIENDDNNQTLHEKLGEIGADLLLKILPDYLEGKLKPKAQDHKNATFTKHISRKDGCFDPDNPPSKAKLQNMIRAFYPWPGVYTDLRFKDKDLRIKFLPGDKIQPEGKKPMTIREFKNGYPGLSKLIENLL